MNDFVGRVRGRGDADDLVALRGFLDEARGANRRIFADADLQQYIEFESEDVVDSEPLPPEEGDPGPRSLVWVRGEALRRRLFTDDELEPIAEQFLSRGLSAWQFLPETRFVAAGMLGMLGYEYGRY